MRKIPDYGCTIINNCLIMDCTDSPNYPKDKAIYYKAICHCGKFFLASHFAIAHNGLWSCGCSPSPSPSPKRGTESEEWAKLVKKAYDYTCQACNERGGRLHSHHINPWSRHPDKRFELANGIVLCESCHAAYHSAFGKGKRCNRSTLDHFIEVRGAQ